MKIPLLLLSVCCPLAAAPAHAQYATGESPYENFNHVSPERQAEVQAEQERMRAKARVRRGRSESVR